MQCSVFSLIPSWRKCPVSGICRDLKPSPILTRGKWWRWQTIPTKLFPWCSQRRGVNIMELWNKGICQNRQQNLNPLYLKNLQDQVTFMSQFSQKCMKERGYFPLMFKVLCKAGYTAELVTGRMGQTSHFRRQHGWQQKLWLTHVSQEVLPSLFYVIQ